MGVVFSSPPSLYKNPTGTAVGMQVVNGSPLDVVSITAKKSASNPQAQLSQLAQGLGGQVGGAPGSLSQYLGGLGIVVGITGSFRDSISPNDGATISASVDGSMHRLEIYGVAFHQMSTPSSGGGCNLPSGTGIERMLGYFQDNRLGNIANAGKWTVVKLGNTALDCVVIGLDFRMMDTKFNVWAWRLSLLVWPDIQTGAATANT